MSWSELEASGNEAMLRTFGEDEEATIEASPNMPGPAAVVTFIRGRRDSMESAGDLGNYEVIWIDETQVRVPITGGTKVTIAGERYCVIGQPSKPEPDGLTRLVLGAA